MLRTPAPKVPLSRENLVSRAPAQHNRLLNLSLIGGPPGRPVGPTRYQRSGHPVAGRAVANPAGGVALGFGP
jgi:hypothetical protein